MSQLDTILENYSILDTPDEIREQIAAAKEDIATWDKTIEDNTSKIVDLAIESMQCRIDIDRAKLELLKLSERLVGLSRTAVIQ